jgi:ABC-type transporter Mla MlaB component
MVKKTAKKTTKKTTKKAASKAAGKKVADATGKTRRKASRKKRASRVTELCIDLNSEQGIRDVAELHQRLLQAVEHQHKVTIDASSVERVDTAILQVLTAFIIERKKQGKVVEWKPPSEVFYQAANLIDLTRHLDLPQPQGSS